MQCHALSCCLKIDVKQKGNTLKLDKLKRNRGVTTQIDLFQSSYMYQ